MDSPSDIIKVLIVDDSSVVRKFIASAIEGCKELKVVGEAANGKEAIEVFGRLQPDIITLDIEMPVMDGIETLAHIRRKDKKVPVVMFSTLTERGARVTLEALSRGANDYIAKPSSLGGKKNAADLVIEEIRQKLVAHGRLRKAANGRAVTTNSASASVVVTAPVAHVIPNGDKAKPLTDKAPLYPIKTIILRESRRLGPFKVLGIGVSTGGPNAMAEIFKDLRVPFGVPIFITQHMPPVFTKMFAEKLKAVSGLQVFEAEQGQRVKPGEVYVAPGGYHLVVVETKEGLTIGLNQEAPENSCRPAVDVMFRSLAKVYGGGGVRVDINRDGE